jgi:YihY family inner membrane protein
VKTAPIPRPRAESDAQAESSELRLAPVPASTPECAHSGNAPAARSEGLIPGLFHYLTQTEVHTYAFSVAANCILSLCPFIVLMFTLARQVFHWKAMESVVTDMVRHFLPTGQDFVARNLALVAYSRHGAQIVSVVMLLISSTGVFLPLEVALNQVWGAPKNRSYLKNQMVTFLLAGLIGIVAMISVAVAAAQHEVLALLFWGHTSNAIYLFSAHWLLQITAAASSVLYFFLIYWILPNRKLPVRAVLPTSIVVGLLWELAKVAYEHALPLLDLRSVYGPFYISVSLMLWAFLTGLLVLAGAHFSATRQTLRLARMAEAALERGAPIAGKADPSLRSE